MAIMTACYFAYLLLGFRLSFIRFMGIDYTNIDIDKIGVIRIGVTFTILALLFPLYAILNKSDLEKILSA
jgi:hypothetical protein